MAIFSRRTLQRMLDETARKIDRKPIIPRGRQKEYVRDLDRTESCLAMEWELAIVWAFAQVGQVIYEQPQKGKTKPDITVSREDGTEPLFVADITTVSDRGIELGVPLEEFQKQFYDLVRALNLRANSFFIQIERDESQSSYERVVLLLPRLCDIPEFVSTSIRPFLMKVLNSPGVQHEFVSPGIKIRYNPRQEFATTVHASYRSVQPQDRHVIRNALQQKAGQLRDAQLSSAQGIFLCDGGCELLRNDRFVQRILRQVFGENGNLSFVAIVSVVEPSGYKKQPRAALVNIFSPPSECLNSGAAEQIRGAFERLPVPVMTPYSAEATLRYGPIRSFSKMGGWEMSSQHIKISARGLLEVITGKSPAACLFDELAATKTEPPSDQLRLRSMLDKGYNIAEIHLEPCADEDDDWITVELKLDPAISPFQLLKHEEPKKKSRARKTASRA